MSTTAAALLTKEQIEKIATNYVLDQTTDRQVLKITKQFRNEHEVDIVNVRVVNSLGKKTTTLVYLYQNVDKVAGDWGGYNTAPTISELLAMELVNPTFGTIEEEQAKIDQAKAAQDAIEEQRLFDQRQRYIDSEYRRGKQRQTLGRFAHELKKHGIEELQAYVPHHEGEIKAFLERCIAELVAKEAQTGKVAYVPGKRTVFYHPALEAIIHQMEESFDAYQHQVYEQAKAYFTHQQRAEGKLVLTPEAEARQYVEEQKTRLLLAVIRDLYQLDITSIGNQSIRNKNAGFEGTWTLRLADGTQKLYKTQSIIASGPVQRMHYRYLTRLT